MLKFSSPRPDGSYLVVLGITAPNVERLQDGQPILVKARDLSALTPDGTVGDLCIVYGIDEQAVADELRHAGIELPDEVDQAIRALRRV